MGKSNARPPVLAMGPGLALVLILALVLEAGLAMMALTGCSLAGFRTVRIEIPPHPWEEVSGKRLWYSLLIEGGDFKRERHIGQRTRTVAVDAPLGTPVAVLAFPLGFASPMGGWISPETGRGPVVLSQADGLVLESLARAKGSLRDLDYPVLAREIRKKTDDFRQVDRPRLAADAANGKLKRSSVALNKIVEVGGLHLPSGLWTSEFREGGTLFKSLSQSPVAALYPGVERFYCFERALMLTLSVGSDGAWESSISAGLLI